MDHLLGGELYVGNNFHSLLFLDGLFFLSWEVFRVRSFWCSEFVFFLPGGWGLIQATSPFILNPFSVLLFSPPVYFLVVEWILFYFLVLLSFLFSGIVFNFIFKFYSSFFVLLVYVDFQEPFWFSDFLIVFSFGCMGVLSSVWMPSRFVFCFSCWAGWAVLT